MGAPVTWLLAKSADLSVVLYPPKGQLSVKCRSAHFDEFLLLSDMNMLSFRPSYTGNHC